jgi:hypothetical protein
MPWRERRSGIVLESYATSLGTISQRLIVCKSDLSTLRSSERIRWVAWPGHAICGEGSSDDLPRRGFTIVPSYRKLLKTLVRPLEKYVETRQGSSDGKLSKALSY